MRFIKYLVFGLLFFYLQILLAPKFVIGSVAPFFMLGFIIFAAFNLNLIESASISFILGIALDLLNPYLLGVHSVLFLILTFIINNYHTMIKKDKPVPLLVSIVLINLMYLFPLLMFKLLVFGYDSLWLKIAFPELIYNSVVTTVILTIMIVGQKIRLVISD